jgi:GDP-4-dehydro-6-deoxy-D-mannose reductase
MDAPERVLVTGATGFIGRHLVARLLWLGCGVTAVYKPDDPLRDVLPPGVSACACDLEDAAQVNALLAETQPALLFHLAGLVRGSDLRQLFVANVLLTDHILQAASRLPAPPRVIIPGSAAEVGLLDNAAVESGAALRPLSVYGVSKAAQTLLAQCYSRQGKAPVVVGRIFNVTGPGEPATMLCGGMAAQIVAVEAAQIAAVEAAQTAAVEAADQPPTLRVGNLSPTRDYLDVRDVVVALWLLGRHGRAGGVHNICSGEERRVEDVVRSLAACSTWPIALEVDPERQRPSDIPRCVGIPDATLAALGWRPTIPLAQSLAETLAWWRLAYRNGPTTPLPGLRGQPIERPGGDVGQETLRQSALFGQSA